MTVGPLGLRSQIHFIWVYALATSKESLTVRTDICSVVTAETCQSSKFRAWTRLIAPMLCLELATIGSDLRAEIGPVRSEVGGLQQSFAAKSTPLKRNWTG